MVVFCGVWCVWIVCVCCMLLWCVGWVGWLFGVGWWYGVVVVFVFVYCGDVEVVWYWCDGWLCFSVLLVLMLGWLCGFVWFVCCVGFCIRIMWFFWCFCYWCIGSGCGCWVWSLCVYRLSRLWCCLFVFWVVWSWICGCVFMFWWLLVGIVWFFGVGIGGWWLVLWFWLCCFSFFWLWWSWWVVCWLLCEIVLCGLMCCLFSWLDWSCSFCVVLVVCEDWVSFDMVCLIFMWCWMRNCICLVCWW